jgi:hypothetical protein
MKIFKQVFIILIIAFSFSQTLFCQSSIEKLLPENWKVVKTIIVPDEKIALFNEKFGGESISITNDIIETDIGRIQINIVNCKSEKDADNIYKTVVSIHKSEEKCMKIGKVVYEFRCNTDELIKKGKSLFKK